MKKIISLILAALMLLAVSVPALADAAPPIETEPEEVLSGWPPFLIAALLIAFACVLVASVVLLFAAAKKKKENAGLPPAGDKDPGRGKE